ncbi:hypothetical protein [Candidatus Uabimicrobium sp. HlEnr_7]|uniref:hypothetical protein n=1 Tax=Candidatus Uabimicrobium helgolandensis TaxID=3095367 RepID=UPI003555ECF4
MNKIILFLFGLMLFICSCSSNKQQNTDEGNRGRQSLIEQEKYTSDPTGNTAIPNSSFGNARIAFLTNKKIKRPSRVRGPRFLGVSDNKVLSTVLVHKNNKRDLILVKEYNGYPYDSIPLSAFKYRAKTLSLTLNRSVVIIEDELMEQIMELAEKNLKFYNYAQKVSAEVVNSPNWPVEDTMVIEKNGEYFALQKPQRLNLESDNPPAKAYLSLKKNLLHARISGHIAQIVNVKKARHRR